MPRLSFYATEVDLAPVVEFVLDDGCELFESNSRLGERIQRWTEPSAVLKALAEAPFSSLYLQLYRPSMRGNVVVRRFDVSVNAAEGALPWRETSQGWGLIQLHLHLPKDGRLGPCSTNHNSEARARKWAPLYPELRS
ncbi:MAG: hypothetical protein AAGF12_42990, partial [Myxococcota bacterium]